MMLYNIEKAWRNFWRHAHHMWICTALSTQYSSIPEDQELNWSYAIRHPWISLDNGWKESLPDDVYLANVLNRRTPGSPYLYQSKYWSFCSTDSDSGGMLLLRGTGWLYRLSWRLSRWWSISPVTWNLNNSIVNRKRALNKKAVQV